MTKKLIVFNVDGVLLDNGLGGFKDILVILKKEKEVQKIDKEYQRRKLAGPWGLKQLAKLYEGFPEERLSQLAFDYCKNNLMPKSKETLTELKNKNYFLGALSSNPQLLWML